MKIDTNRRAFLACAGTGLLAAALPKLAISEPSVPFSAGTERPKFALPSGTIDCHHHIYDSRFPSAPGVTLRPPNASVSDYRLLQSRLGFERNVVVTPSTYGVDNRCTVDALQQLGPSARGVAVVDTSVTDAELQRLHDAGVRAIRFNLSYPGATTVDMMKPLSARIAQMEWHVEMVIGGAHLPELESLLSALPCPVVIDHIAHVPEPGGLSSEAFKTASRLLQKGNTWMKLSGPYIDSKVGSPSYGDVSGVAKAFVATAPERLVWGTDWPHPTALSNSPDDAILVDLITTWIPSQQIREQIFVHNAATLYGFDV